MCFFSFAEDEFEGCGEGGALLSKLEAAEREAYCSEPTQAARASAVVVPGAPCRWQLRADEGAGGGVSLVAVEFALSLRDAIAYATPAPPHLLGALALTSLGQVRSARTRNDGVV